MHPLEELAARGLIAQVSDREALHDHLDSGQRTVYCGFDPTAESLHVGSLVPLLALRRFQQAGHRPILLLGGATGLIGDPSGRSNERSLNDPATVAGWVARIRAQVEPFLSFDGPAAAEIVNNLDWTADLPLIEFLRDIGKHFSVNAMIQRDSVRTRLDREGDGISYTEFSYMLLQAMDYLHLAREFDCSLQIGGSDQWGNIVSGMDLVRRILRRESYALTLPLVTRSDGVKFGKTASGAVWLDPQKTSPYAFYQFFLNSSDADVGKFLGYFTFLDPSAIEAVLAAHALSPERREGQRCLARQITELVHGSAAVEAAERIGRVLFEGQVNELSETDLAQLALDGMDAVDIADPGFGLLDALVRTGLASSNSAARKLVTSKAIRVNTTLCEQAERQFDWSDALHGRYYVVRRGKKNWALISRAAQV
ncbi:MAG TPA: tyrosine--tRNA ligase [Gammaproteobacteria bacterium]|jgi:tyrosyl-tRNA synthetase|nr:tyrosine--tRNA ligase [Gammaproteobacteria bacterium]